MNDKSLAVIVNPMSGWGRSRRILKTTLAILSRMGLPFSVWESQKPGDNLKHAFELTRGNSTDTIIVIGGDGTVHEVLNGILHAPPSAKPKLTIIPAGSSNDIAQSLSIPENIQDNLFLIKNHQTQRIDVGEVNGRYFIMAGALGIFAQAARYSMHMKGLYGSLRYLTATLWAIFRHKEGWHMKIKTDTDTIEGCFGVLMVGNLTRFGGLTLLPQARPNDGYLDGLLIESMGRFEAIKMLYHIGRHGSIEHPRAKSFKTRNLTLEWPKGGLVNTDGETFEADGNTLTWTIHPGAINIFAPPSL